MVELNQGSGQLDLSVIKVMVKDFTAGAVGGTACVLSGQPLDTLKVKLQAFPHLYRNAFDCFKQTLRQESFRGLYAGTVPSLAANISENAVLFLAYGRCRQLVQYMCGVEKEEDLGVLHKACSGSLASIFSSMVLCPTELIKCRLQAQHQLRTVAQNATEIPKRGPLSMTAKILRTEGLKGMYQGPHQHICERNAWILFLFGGYEMSKYLLTPKGRHSEGSLLITPLCGGLAGVCLWVAIFPIDVVKSRIQVLSSQRNSPKLTFSKISMQIFRDEGIRAFYKGLGPTILRSFPANGALFLAYEWTLIFLKDV